MARKPNMWSASAAVGDAELRGIPEGWAPEHDGTLELPRSAGNQSPSVYSVGKLGGAHRRTDKERPARGGGRTGDTGAWTSVDPSGGNTGQYEMPAGSTGQYDIPPYQEQAEGFGVWQDVVPQSGPGNYPPGHPVSGYPISGNPTSGYPSRPTSSYPASGTPASGTPVSGYPASGTPTSSYPTSSRPSGSMGSSAGYGGSRRASANRPATKGKSRRPVRYTGQRRRFSGWVPLAGGALMLALVLGATTLAESGRYSDSDTGGTTATGPTAASTSAADKAPAAVDTKPAQAVALALNKELDNLGCGRVAVDKSLVTAAQEHVDSMAAAATDTKPDTSGSLDRAKTAGYKGQQVAEAVVTGAGSPDQAAQFAFPNPGTTPNLPATVQVTSGQAISCGWTAVGAQAQMGGGQVTYWSIVLGR